MSDGSDPRNVLRETVLDTGAEHLGTLYAEALLGAAKNAGAVDDVLEQLGAFVDSVLAEHPALGTALASRRVGQDEKVRVLDRLLGDQVHPVLLQFLKVTARRERLEYLPYIHAAALRLIGERAGRVVAEVRTAVPLTDALRDAVRQRLEEQAGKQVLLREKVDPGLVGGFVVRIGDTLFDASVAGRLDDLAASARAGFARRLAENAELFASGELSAG